MLQVVLIAIVCGGLSILFFLLEVHQSLKNLDKFLATHIGISRVAILWKLPLCFYPLLSDTSVTLFAIWLFGMHGGMVGMMVSMMVSVMSSFYFQIRLLRHPIKFDKRIDSKTL